MNAFLSLSDHDADFVVHLLPYLHRSFADIYYYGKKQKANEDWKQTLNTGLRECDVFIIFIGRGEVDSDGNSICPLSSGQKNEINFIERRKRTEDGLHIVTCLIEYDSLPMDIDGDTQGFLSKYPIVAQIERSEQGARKAAKQILDILKLRSVPDGLPSNPLLFSYEKDIINHYVTEEMLHDFFGKYGVDANAPAEVLVAQLTQNSDIVQQLCERMGIDPSTPLEEQIGAMIHKTNEITQRQFEGCPIKWPVVHRYRAHDERTIHGEYEKMIRSEGNGRIDNAVIANDIRVRKKEWESKVGSFRKEGNVVVAAALSKYHQCAATQDEYSTCMIRQGMCFPEAGPREFVHFPRGDHRIRGKEKLTVGILVSGGIAPGINAVIDGIVQRHRLYAKEFKYFINDVSSGVFNPVINGFENGFLACHNRGDMPTKNLSHIDTAHQASEGGSLLGTSRFDDLLDHDKRIGQLERIVERLYDQSYDILYVIGGDGSMKAAHALWTIAQAYAKENSMLPLSIVAIPKTMDNDILWVWQTFGFLSAVEKAREIINHLSTEVESNPRLCVAQLYGSDSGFVVSHAVLASRPEQCDVALIPEIGFSIKGVAEYLRSKMINRDEPVPRGLVIMAETAIPRDVKQFIDLDRESKKEPHNGVSSNGVSDREPIIGLTAKEEKALLEFDHDKRIEGQTPDELRSGGLKLVSRGLKYVLENPDAGVQPFRPRLVTNEPRHLLRAIPPSCTDIIMGNRLGTLAVDNAIAGYTDFMISQWLTEYVLVPLELVALGRKRIPKEGVFWKSVIGKTGQPADLL